VHCPFALGSAPNRVKPGKTKRNQVVLFFVAANQLQPMVSVAAVNKAKTEKDGLKRTKTERNGVFFSFSCQPKEKLKFLSCAPRPARLHEPSCLNL
jgi:hypothetical protein